MDKDRQDSNPPRRVISRRDLLKGAAAAGVAGATLSWRDMVQSQTVWAQSSPAGSVVYWNLFGGGDGARMIQLEQDFQRAYPKIKLQSTTLAWGIPYYTKLTTSTVAGKPPNVGIMHLSRMDSFAPKGLLTELDPSMLASYGITPNTISADPWKKAHYNGKLYAIPLDTHPFVMYYNTRVARKAGLLGANGQLKHLQGVNEVMAAFEKAQHYTKWGLAMATGGAGEVMPWRLWYAIYRQMGGSVVSNGGKTVDLKHTSALRATAFLHDLTHKYRVVGPNIDYIAQVALFNSQKAAFMWNGEWEVTTFQKSGIPFDMTLFPNLFGGLATWSDSHSFIIPKSASLTDAQLHATLTFIGYVLKHSQIWAQGGHIPAYLPVVHSAAYKNLKPNSHYAAEAKHIQYEPLAPYSGAAGPMEIDAGKAFIAVLNGQATPAQGVGQLASSLKQLSSSSGGPPGTL